MELAMVNTVASGQTAEEYMGRAKKRKFLKNLWAFTPTPVEVTSPEDGEEAHLFAGVGGTAARRLGHSA